MKVCYETERNFPHANYYNFYYCRDYEQNIKVNILSYEMEKNLYSLKNKELKPTGMFYSELFRPKFNHLNHKLLQCKNE